MEWKWKMWFVWFFILVLSHECWMLPAANSVQLWISLRIHNTCSRGDIQCTRPPKLFTHAYVFEHREHCLHVPLRKLNMAHSLRQRRFWVQQRVCDLDTVWHISWLLECERERGCMSHNSVCTSFEWSRTTARTCTAIGPHPQYASHTKWRACQNA